MAIHPDILASATREHMPKLSDLFTVYHPLLQKIVEKGNLDTSTLEGTHRSFPLVLGGPGKLSGIKSGGKVMSSVRRAIGDQGEVYAGRMIYHYDVPGIDLARANGAKDVAKLLQKYPEAAMGDYLEIFAAWFATGTITGSVGHEPDGLVSLYDGVTYEPEAGRTRSGVFSFAAPASQTTTVFSVPKQGAASGAVEGWYNVYRDVTGFSSDGKRSLREAANEANRKGAKLTGGIDMMMSDEASFHNYAELLDDQILVAKIEGDKAADVSTEREYIPFGKAKWFLDEAIDTTATNFVGTPAVDGLTFLFNTSHWHLLLAGHDEKMETKGYFSARDAQKVPDMDAWRYEIVFDGQIYCDSLRRQAAVTGTAVM